MKENLRDYLYKKVQSFDVSEDEKKDLYEYIELISQNFEGVYTSIDSDDKKNLIIKSLENYAKKSMQNV